MKKVLLILFCAFFITGCAGKIPKGTSAKFSLSKKIAARIGILQMKYVPECKTRVLNTRVISKNENVIFEEWTVGACGVKMLYMVELFPTKKGILSFNVQRIK